MRFIIPPAKAKRMSGRPKKVIARFFGVYDGYEREEEYMVGAEVMEFAFTPPPGVEYISHSSTCDGDYFSIYVEYSNESGSRKEFYTLNPEPETADG